MTTPDRFSGDDGAADADESVLCDGCNVLPPHEHRCHGDGPIVVEGERVDAACDCPDCREAGSDCRHYAAAGRDRSTCKLSGLKVAGITTDKACFSARPERRP